MAIYVVHGVGHAFYAPELARLHGAEIVVRERRVQRRYQVPVDFARLRIVHLPLYDMKDTYTKSGAKDIRTIVQGGERVFRVLQEVFSQLP